MSVLIKGLNIKPCKDGSDWKGFAIIGCDESNRSRPCGHTGRKGRRMRKRNDDMNVSDLSDFAEWVAGMICSDDFEEYADEFAELACRKLWRLGYIVKDGEDWKREE